MKHEALIQSMTLEEKCSLLSGATQFSTKAVERRDIPAMWLSDGPHGLRRRPPGPQPQPPRHLLPHGGHHGQRLG